MSFIVSKLSPGGMVRPVRELAVAAGAAFLKGALLVRDGEGKWAECGADPAAIGAVAESDYGASSTGFIHHGTKEFPPGYMQGTLVQNEVPFRARYVGTLPAADGGSYGVVRDTDAQWKVDFNETTATKVKLIRRFTGSPENVAQVEVVVLAAAVQVQ